MSKKVIIINETEDIFSVNHWRKRFAELSTSVSDYNIRELSKYDNIFLSSVGKSAMSNVKRGVGGLEPTMRAVKALELLIKDRNADALADGKVAKNQKLVLP